MSNLEEKKGLWANIHAKRKRIAAGSGERMRKPGEKGAPTAASLKAAQESIKTKASTEMQPYNSNNSASRFDASKELVSIYKKDTPGQSRALREIKKIMHETNSFRSYNNDLFEELTTKQKQQVSKWPRDPKAIAHTDHFFGAGNDEIHEPLQNGGDKSEPHRAVETHLGHEIPHEDYKAGKTKDKYGREVKIGSVLQKSKADPQLINAYANDSTRQLKKESNLSVHVTRSAAGVAGQTSSGQSWKDESCKNFENGSNKNYLKPEVKHGTVVAYLKNHHGHELARATLHPHSDENGNVIYKHNSYYGPKVKEFENHVKRLESRLSQPNAPKDSVYNIHPKVYNDRAAEKMQLHPDANAEHLHKALNDKDKDVKHVAASHPNANAEHLHKALNDKDAEVRRAATKNPNANAEHLHKALNDKDYVVRSSVASHPNANAEHLHKALNDKDYLVKHAAASHPNANAEHLHKALNDKDSDVRRAAAKNPNANAEHLHKALNDEDSDVRRAAVINPKANAEHLHKALNDENPAVKKVAASHPNANAEHLHKALNDKDAEVRRAAASNPKANAEHLHKALNDKDYVVRFGAVSNPKANAEHLHKALNDENPAVKKVAEKSLNQLRESQSVIKLIKNIIKEAAVDSKGYKSSTGGLTQKGRDHYNRQSGGNLQAPVTKEPSKLKPGSKAANRRKSFCARMGGMKKRLTSAKTARDPDSRINKALRKWNC